ncbi:unnamed protein product, partial [marine sediment metagenome]
AHLIPGMPTEEIDRLAAEHMRLQESGGLNEDPAGQFGNIVGQAAPYFAGGGALTKMGPVKAGLTEAGIETTRSPTGGDFWKEKGKQGAINTALGVGINKGADMGIGMYQASRNAPNALMDFAQRPAKGEPMMRADPAQLAEGNRIAESTGISFTPGQRSQAPIQQQLEQYTGESLITRGEVRAGNEIREQQLEAGINRVADSLGPNAPKEAVAKRVQGFVNEEADKLIQTRRTQADADYRPIQSDTTPFDAPNLERELARIVNAS